MGSRRRNGFIILLVLGLLVASGLVIATKTTVLGLDLKGGTQLVYEARGTQQVPNPSGADIDRAIVVTQRRSDIREVHTRQIIMVVGQCVHDARKLRAQVQCHEVDQEIRTVPQTA